MRSTADVLAYTMATSSENAAHAMRQLLDSLGVKLRLLLALDDAAQSNGATWADLDYLTRRVPIAYVPSATMLAMIRQNHAAGRYCATNRRPALLFGDPAEPLLKPLPGTREEVMAISQILYQTPTNQHTFLGPQCSEATVQQLNRMGVLRPARMIVSLWSSDDEACIALMRAFYRNLAAGEQR